VTLRGQLRHIIVQRSHRHAGEDESGDSGLSCSLDKLAVTASFDRLMGVAALRGRHHIRGGDDRPDAAQRPVKAGRVTKVTQR